MLFRGIKPRKFQVRDESLKPANKDEDRFERIRFRSLLSQRNTGDRSLGWLVALFIIALLILWYLGQY